WSERHPPQSSSPPALADHAVGSGTDGTYIYSMYKRTTSTSECHFQFVKYEADGTFKAEARWPGADEPVGEYIPRAMKVVHTGGSQPRTDIFIVGDVPDPNASPPGRRVVTMALNENSGVR